MPLIQSIFLSCKVLMLTGPGDLDLLFDVILSQEKLKILIKRKSINITTNLYILHCQF